MGSTTASQATLIYFADEEIGKPSSFFDQFFSTQILDRADLSRPLGAQSLGLE